MKLTKYSQLKHGMKVTCEIYGVKITDAKISINIFGDAFICQDKKNDYFLRLIKDKFGYKCWWILAFKDEDIDDWEEHITNLQTAGPRTLRDMVVGDIIVDEDGDEAMVLEVLKNSFSKSLWDCRFNKVDDWFTFEQAEEYGWELKDEDPEEDEETTYLVKDGKKYEVKIIREVE